MRRVEETQSAQLFAVRRRRGIGVHRTGSDAAVLMRGVTGAADAAIGVVDGR